MKYSTISHSKVCTKPTFFHIGWMRTGTTFLQGIFSHDPRINLSLKNRFFSYDPYFSRGAEFYKNNIILGSQSEQHNINIDSDENYAMGRFKTQLREKGNVKYNHKSELGFIYHDIGQMVSRMKECVPDAKVFGMIRKQPDWFESVYKHDVFHFGLDHSFPDFYKSSLGQAYRKAADYFSVYQQFASAFGTGNIKIFLFEDFVNDKKGFVGELSEFLDVDIQMWDEKKLKKNASTSGFFALMHRYANKLSEKDPLKPERKFYSQTRKWVGRLNSLSNKLNLKLNKEIISEPLKAEIQQQYISGNQHLASSLGLEDKMKQYGYVLMRLCLIMMNVILTGYSQDLNDCCLMAWL